MADGDRVTSDDMMSVEADSQSEAQPGFLGLMREDVSCVFERDPAARTFIEVLLTYPGVHAILAQRVSHGLWTRGFRFLARLVSFLSRMFTNIDIHPGATIGRRFFIDHGAGVVIGETAIVGNDVTLYHGVTLGGVSWNKGRRHPTVEDGVIVGGGAKILGPITVRTGAKVGANSVVIAEVPAGRTVVGIPARVVKTGVESMPHPFGVDLNHHLIPDPVAEAVTCLMDRIHMLEMKLEQATGDAVDTNETCTNCGSALCPDPTAMIDIDDFNDFEQPAKSDAGA